MRRAAVQTAAARSSRNSARVSRRLPSYRVETEPMPPGWDADKSTWAVSSPPLRHRAQSVPGHRSPARRAARARTLAASRTLDPDTAALAAKRMRMRPHGSMASSLAALSTASLTTLERLQRRAARDKMGGGAAMGSFSPSMGSAAGYGPGAGLSGSGFEHSFGSDAGALYDTAATDGSVRSARSSAAGSSARGSTRPPASRHGSELKPVPEGGVGVGVPAMARSAATADSAMTEEEIMSRTRKLKVLEMITQAQNRIQQVSIVRAAEDRTVLLKSAIILGVAVFGVLCMIMDEESCWAYGEEYLYELDYKKEVSWVWWDFLLVASTVALLVLIVDMYWFRAGMVKRRWDLTHRIEAFRRPELFLPLLAELVICAVQPLPRFVRYGIDSTFMHRQLGLLMFARVYLIARVFRNASPVYRTRHRAQLMGKMPAHRVSFMVAMRAQLRSGPMYVILPGLLLCLGVFSYSIFCVERAYRWQGIDSNIYTITRAIWFCVATLTTVGYGDVYPSKSTGYTTAMLEGVVAMVLTSLLVAVVIERLSVKGNELRHLNWVQSEAMEREYREAAKHVLRIVVGDYFWRLKLERLAKEDEAESRDPTPASQAAQGPTQTHGAGSGAGAGDGAAVSEAHSASGSDRSGKLLASTDPKSPPRRRKPRRFSSSGRLSRMTPSKRVAFVLYRYCQPYVRRMRYFRQLREELEVENHTAVLDRVLEHQARSAQVLEGIDNMLRQQGVREAHLARQLSTLQADVAVIKRGLRQVLRHTPVHGDGFSGAAATGGDSEDSSSPRPGHVSTDSRGRPIDGAGVHGGAGRGGGTTDRVRSRASGRHHRRWSSSGHGDDDDYGVEGGIRVIASAGDLDGLFGAAASHVMDLPSGAGGATMPTGVATGGSYVSSHGASAPVLKQHTRSSAAAGRGVAPPPLPEFGARSGTPRSDAAMATPTAAGPSVAGAADVADAGSASGTVEPAAEHGAAAAERSVAAVTPPAAEDEAGSGTEGRPAVLDSTAGGAGDDAGDGAGAGGVDDSVGAVSAHVATPTTAGDPAVQG